MGVCDGVWGCAAWGWAAPVPLCSPWHHPGPSPMARQLWGHLGCGDSGPVPALGVASAIIPNSSQQPGTDLWVHLFRISPLISSSSSPPLDQGAFLSPCHLHRECPEFPGNPPPLPILCKFTRRLWLGRMSPQRG